MVMALLTIRVIMAMGHIITLQRLAPTLEGVAGGTGVIVATMVAEATEVGVITAAVVVAEAAKNLWLMSIGYLKSSLLG